VLLLAACGVTSRHAPPQNTVTGRRTPDSGQGAIVCVSSRAAKQPFSGAAGYVVAKAAVLAFVDALAAEYGGEGIRVNAILPSIIDTPANRVAQPGADTARWVRPDDIAETVYFLCSAEAGPIVGAHLPVYGLA
jgi:NAD(P)-dependent dehydrogenase (short-subunit alcohol dehydrogenase family)